MKHLIEALAGAIQEANAKDDIWQEKRSIRDANTSRAVATQKALQIDADAAEGEYIYALQQLHKAIREITPHDMKDESVLS